MFTSVISALLKLEKNRSFDEQVSISYPLFKKAHEVKELYIAPSQTINSYKIT